MNGALGRSEIAIEYRQWGSVQMLEQTNAEMISHTNDENPNEKFINALGDSEEARKQLKQSADHIILILDDYPGPYRCLIFSPWWEMPYTEDYATATVALDAPGLFIHEAGHCLGAMHDRYTSGNAGVNDDRYNHGYCLPGNKYATVMSYTYRCPKNDAGDDIERILYFSNPDVSFEGIPTGTDQENNARAIREDRDETSQRGTNCFTGFPEPGSPMGKNVCAWTEWTGFSEWGECCCEEDWKKCPLVPSGKWWRYTPEERIRKNSRTCQNGLQESVYKAGCATDGDEEVEIFETERCDCTPAKEACAGVGIAAEGVGYSDAHFHLTGLKPGDKVDFAFRTLDDWGDEKYQNTGIAIKGSPDGVWNQFLYDRGTSKGQVTLGAEDDGFYVHVFPYTHDGGWDFEACKA